MSSLETLIDLYSKTSKHSNYQILSERLMNLIGPGSIDVTSRFERERFEYIRNRVSLAGMRVLDIGGNTGFFSFEALEAGAIAVHHFEGEPSHSAFVQEATDVLGYASKVEVTNAYYSFPESGNRQYDVTFLLNVLHHVGDDYGDSSLSIENARKMIGAQLRSVAATTDILVFQMGFCWKGNRNLGLFENGTKREMIDFVIEHSKDTYQLEHVGVPVMRAEKVIYEELDDENVSRDDALGEFLNRPIFVLRAIR
jgi:hypothetical protein